MKQINLKMAAVAISCVCMLFCAQLAHAHRLNMFAWLENDDIIVECNFGKGHPARGAAVKILDRETRKELLALKTDDNGRCVFEVPEVIRKGNGLIIDVNAGQGHHSDWSMDASELYAAASLTAGFDEAAHDNPGQSQNHPQTAENIPMPSSTGLEADQVRAIVQEIVEKHVAPIRQILAAQSASGPGITEIIGGIGWIIGLVGIGLYFKNRKQ